MNDARCVSENPLGAFEQWADDAAIDVMKGRVGAAFARVGLRENRPGLVVRVEVLDWWVVFVSNVSFERSAIVRARLRATTGGPWMTAEATEALSVSIARFEARAVAELFGDALTRAADRLAVELASEHP
ncbi:MAG: hypothetical protein SFW67_25050 [Myxococcaceae bacterium]|nr:hypothetical protein [Myxococcaceae bacterium]